MHFTTGGKSPAMMGGGRMAPRRGVAAAVDAARRPMLGAGGAGCGEWDAVAEWLAHVEAGRIPVR